MIIPVLSLATPLLLTTFVSAGRTIQKRDSWGGAVSLGPTTSTIIRSSTTVIPGLPPATQGGDLALWPGISNGTGDLIQTVLDSVQDNSWCGAVTGKEWCVEASMFGAQGQTSGGAVAVGADERILIVYELQDDQMTWFQ